MTQAEPSRRTLRTAASVGLVALALLAGAAILWGFRRDEKPPPTRSHVESSVAALETPAHPPFRPTPPSGEGYVGSEACAKCHGTIAREFAAHPMGRSSSVVPSANDVEEYGPQTLFKPEGRRQYWVEQQGDTVLHHEVMVDAQGENIYDQAEPVHYSIGSGTRGKSYVVDRDGVLFMSPISWYARGARWDLSPGYAPHDHPRFERRVSKECLLCHTGRFRQRPGRQDVFEQEVFQELTIGCERCHGPGQAHVAAQQTANPPKPDRSIVNPATLPPDRREDVCNQCHLQGLASVPRYGMSFADFRPGAAMDDCWSTLLAGTGVREGGSTKAVSQVQQMAASACYTNSDGKLGCISCHDAHSTPPEDEKAHYYRQRCLACHEEQGCSLSGEERAAPPALNSCVHCHMPRLSAHDVAHASQTDHRIPRLPSGDAAGLKANGPQSELTFFADEETRLEPWEAYRARGIGLARISESQFLSEPGLRQAEELLKEVVKIVPDDIPSLEALGSACVLMRKEGDAREYLDRILKMEPEHEKALSLLTIVCYQTGDYQAGLEYVERLQRINPWISLDYARQAKMLGQFHQTRRAIQAGLRGLELDPSQTTLRGWLVEAYQSVGDRAAARREMEILQRIESR